MTARPVNLCFDANDPMRLARFWADAVHWDVSDDGSDEVAVVPTDGTRFIFLFLPVPEPKTWKNRIHLELNTESLEHQTETVARLLSLGAQHVDIGQTNTADGCVLADPEGNEFCLGVRGEFLADTDLVGAITFEPARHATGHFWSEATGWPVVYDQDGDTAIRDPSGTGPFITFGPPIDADKPAKNRVHLDIAPWPDGDRDAEVERLIAIGARRVDIGQGDVPWVVMADPDGNEFCVLRPR